MNIFALFPSGELSAKSLCNVHVVKMLLESVQMLYTAWHMLGDVEEKPWDGDEEVLKPYKATHTSHPCVKWVIDEKAHYDWLIDHAFHISAEYTRRYKKVHKCHAHLVRFKAFRSFPGMHRRQLVQQNSSNKRKRRSAPSTISAKWSKIIFRILKRSCNVNKLPAGWKWFEVAIADDVFKLCRRLDADGELDVFATYRSYYVYKKMLWSQPGKREMKWDAPAYRCLLWGLLTC